MSIQSSSCDTGDLEGEGRRRRKEKRGREGKGRGGTHNFAIRSPSLVGVKLVIKTNIDPVIILETAVVYMTV